MRSAETADERRKQIMAMLSSGGALEHYASLREEAGRLEGEVQTLSDRLVAAERIVKARKLSWRLNAISSTQRCKRIIRRELIL